ncbi:hypothetical protein [Methylomagnum ishizawai]|uniref:hypothetical protein n=1 Tax=Methylomagnum ishizawai TaxID=1760988 RepID=UPI001C340FE9|nr:hypothetical protein [Methylomagnum ishizawai]BBL77313.1 hypothetical protein MishRS11D_44110 [Methylomagnum ishizawai]
MGLSVFAIDGSKYRLPAFDPDGGLDRPGRGHYPLCLVSTAHDMFRRIPIARTVQPMARADEREEAKALLPHIPPARRRHPVRPGLPRPRPHRPPRGHPAHLVLCAANA